MSESGESSPIGCTVWVVLDGNYQTSVDSIWPDYDSALERAKDILMVETLRMERIRASLRHPSHWGGWRSEGPNLWRDGDRFIAIFEMEVGKAPKIMPDVIQ